mmetsp:Transcript_19420/g.54076  ORF Transcript_19420/g.54076 Transcript_19420/m.54076 type:complete len:264 (-) Transcript_19420:111-902(-)|eukprot:CAMPEP_0117685012 /NCGR_PEP_ID=MMETSP0804-20121206/21487_1 /TAXON_ID=1074897 /ORGANISM="Tetraselmis astigmatica, Strain CCMP880" /LENGTH=263 /DNA_ID=CAMNT_0005496205 /DNA_START=180 /DNA_END=971 /DNA_ORIENTATION=+
MAGRHGLAGLTAYQRHQKLVHDYVTYYGGRIPAANENAPRTKTDWEVLREQHKFLRTDGDDKLDTWEVKLAKRYYDKLFKEYCIADLALYKEGKIGMRWRTQKEVIAGKGQFICGNKRCDSRTGLASYEVNFGYREDGEARQALVKLRVCTACAAKLNYKKQMALSSARKRKEGQRDDEKATGKRRTPLDRQRGRGAHAADTAEPSEGREPGSGSPPGNAELPDDTAGSEKPEVNAIWRTKQPSSSEPNPEEEFDKYFEDMFM